MRIWSWITGVITTVSLFVAPILSTVDAIPIAKPLAMNASVNVDKAGIVANADMYNHIERRNIGESSYYCKSDTDCFHSGTCLTSSDGSWSACKCQGNIWSGGNCQFISNLWQCKQNRKTKKWTLGINQGDGYKISSEDCSWIDIEYAKFLGSDMLRCVNTNDGQQKFIYNSFKTEKKAQTALDNVLIWATNSWESTQMLSNVKSEFPDATHALTIEVTDKGRYKIQSLQMEYNLCNYWETILESATLSIPNKCSTTPGLCATNENCVGSLSEYHCILSDSN